MAQGKALASTRAVNALNANNPRELRDNQSLEKRADGSVWLIETRPPNTPGPDKVERRVDCANDADHIAKGGSVWWMDLLAKQEAAEKPAPAKRSTRTTKGSDE